MAACEALIMKIQGLCMSTIPNLTKKSGAAAQIYNYNTGGMGGQAYS